MKTIIPFPEPDPLEGLYLDDLDIVLAPCPTWCVQSDGHADAVDTPLLRHRNRVRLLDPVHGGGDAYRHSRVTIAVQLEQFADRSAPPIVVLSTEHNGDERFAHLTIPEARTLRDNITAAITEAELETDAA